MKTKQGFSLRQLGNEYILVGEGADVVDFNKMVTFNESAAYLWRRAEQAPSINADLLALWLQEEYEVGVQQAHADAAAVLRSWHTAGIVTE